MPKTTCPECDRVFDLANADDADEWYAGHDCEVEAEYDDDLSGEFSDVAQGRWDYD